MSTDETRKLRTRLRGLERKLEKERREFGHYRDGAGSRYLLGPYYLLLGDLEGALESFEWFGSEFSDDIGEPGHSLCWALALHRGSQAGPAIEQLKRTALSNIYLLPHLLGDPVPTHPELWLGSNQEWLGYVESIPPEYFQLWSSEEKEWAMEVSSARAFGAIVDRWVQIHAELLALPPGEKRSELVREARSLRGTPIQP